MPGPNKDDRIAELEQKVKKLEIENQKLRQELTHERLINRLTMEKPQQKKRKTDDMDVVQPQVGPRDAGDGVRVPAHRDDQAENEDDEDGPTDNFDNLSIHQQRRLLDPIIGNIKSVAQKYNIEPKRLFGRIIGKFIL